MKIVYNWLDIIQKHLLPTTCILCDHPGFGDFDLCLSCHQRLPRQTLCCYQCAESFATTVSSPALCGRCLSEPPAFDNTLAPFLHQNEIRHLVTGLKFGSQYKNARLLGLLLAEYLEMINIDKPDCIIPVPLHPSRYRERGFNQALEIARTVADKLQIPIDFTTCIRRKDTPHQTGLSAKKRRQNIKRAFVVKQSPDYHHVAIIDDVMTTGSTANVLATVLKNAGVHRVDIWVCARA